MKKIAILFILALLIPACGKGGGGDEDTSFRIKPGTLTKFNSPVPGGINGTSYSTDLAPNGNYAVIFTAQIGGVNYVGIALSDNPDPEAALGSETFNLKIYFQSDSIPSGNVPISNSNANCTARVGGNTYTGISAGTLTLNFSSAPTSNSAFPIYNITQVVGSINIGAGSFVTLSSVNINALKAN